MQILFDRIIGVFEEIYLLVMIQLLIILLKGEDII